MQEIRAWLTTAGKPYDEGVKLYAKYGRDARLKLLFSEDETDFKKKKLIQVLKAIIDAPVTTAPKSKAITLDQVVNLPPITSKPPAPRLRSWSLDPTLDPIEKALHEQWLPAYSELMSLQQRIYDVALQAESGNPAKKMEACQMALRIVELDSFCEGIYRELDFYRETGRLANLPTQPEVVGDPVRWATILANLKRYRREYRGKLQKHPADKKAPKWAQKLADIEKDISQYSKLLKLDDEAD